MSDFSEKFDIRFQKCFAAFLIRDSEFLDRVGPDLKPEIFANTTLQRLLRIVLDFWQQEHAAPDTLIFQVLDKLHVLGVLGQDAFDLCNKTADELFAVKLQNRQYLLNEYVTFLKHQLFKTKLPQAVEYEKKGDFEACENILKEVFLFKAKKSDDLGGFLDADPAARIERRKVQDVKRFWTLIPEVDSRIDGLRGGELGVFQSQRSSAGKTAALAFLARSFAFQGRKVAIYTIEMSRESYEDRMDQTIAGLTKSGLTDEVAIRTRMSAMLRHGGNVFIQDFPMNKTRVSDLKRHWEMLQSVYGYRADALIVDYADILQPETRELRSNMFAAGEEIYQELHGWLQEEDLVCWTGMQSNREAMNETHADQKHAGGSIAKIQIADLVLSINRTEEEEKNGITRLNVVKSRNDPARYDIEIRHDFSRMQFWAGCNYSTNHSCGAIQ